MLINEIFKIKNDTEFNNAALKIFQFQLSNNKIYSKYAQSILKNKIPKSINEIPFLPIQFFKHEKIICKNKTEEKIFLSSGTGGQKSKHYISDISIYNKSFIKGFEFFYGDISDYCILSLIPNYRENPNSSLVHMIDQLIFLSKNKESNFFLNDFEKLNSSLKKQEQNGKKTILFGVISALIQFAEKYPQELNNTIIIETGGTKENEQEIIKEELHDILKRAFSVTKIHSEYGMTELLSQSYSNGDGLFKSPPWKKILVRDVYDPLSINKQSKSGGINIIDLANIYSCPFIATEDLGVIDKNFNFKILGRLEKSDTRGCNLLIS